jgi:plasmid stabilization system protein ParE
MAVLINWSDEAKKTFDDNVAYLEENWSERELKNFILQTNHVLSRLASWPEMYSQSKKNPKIRKAAVNKYIILFYQYYPYKEEVILLAFWHNKQNREKLKY